MANRSYLYVQPEEGKDAYKDFSEWRTEVPLSHLLLVGVDTRVEASSIWVVDEKIALSGDAKKGLELFVAFLEWLEPKLDDPNFARDKQEALKMLQSEDYRGERYHLEVGELLELGCYSLDEMEAETRYYADRARQATERVQNLIQDPNASLESIDDYDVRRAVEDWQQNLGLYFTTVTYFSLG